MMKKLLIYSTLASLLLMFQFEGKAATNLGQLDSIVYNLNNIGKVRKAVYEYTAKKLSSISTSEATSMDGSWTPFQKLLYSESNGIQSTIEQKYNPATSSYINSIKTDISFDSKGNRSLQAYYVWDDTAAMWKGFRTKIERTYSDTGIISSFTYSAWDSIVSSWKVYTQGNITLSPFRKPEQIIYSAPDESSQLIPTSKIITTYLPNNNAEYETTYTYNSGTSTYTPVFRTHYEYADVAPQSTQTLESYFEAKQAWALVQKTENSYNVNGDLIRSMVADRDTAKLSWKERYRHDFSILSNSVDSLNIQQTDAPDGTTLFTKKYKQTADGSGLVKIANSVEQNSAIISSQLQQINSSAGDVNLLTSNDYVENMKITWDFNASNSTFVCSTYNINAYTKQTDLVRTATLYFNPNETALPKVLDEKHLSYWPNPVESNLNITNSSASQLTYRILSLEGKPILSGASDAKITTLSATSLQPGAYIIQLTLGKTKTKTGIFIKK